MNPEMQKIRLLFLASLYLGFIFFHSCHRGQVPFTFVQMCDPQLGMGGYGHDTASLSQVVRQVNELDADFVLICGDLVHHPSDSSFNDFRDITAGFDMPVYLVAGNHDVGNSPSDSSLRYFRENLGEDYYDFTYGGWAFVICNTQLWKNSLGEESVEHDRWFRQVLIRYSGRSKPMVVVGHHPLFVRDPSEEEAYFNLPSEKRKEILDLFVEHGIKAYLSGHKHETLLNNYMGIQLVTGESTSRNFDDRPLGFRIWEVTRDSLRNHFVPLEIHPE